MARCYKTFSCLFFGNKLKLLSLKNLKASKIRSRAEQSRAEQSRAEQSRAEQSRAEQSRAEQSRAEQSRAEQSTQYVLQLGHVSGLAHKFRLGCKCLPAINTAAYYSKV